MKDMKEADACHLYVGVIACKPGRWNGGRRPTLPRLPRPSRGMAALVRRATCRLKAIMSSTPQSTVATMAGSKTIRTVPLVNIFRLARVPRMGPKAGTRGGALPGYTGFRDDWVDSLGQTFPLAGASCVSNKTSIEK